MHVLKTRVAAIKGVRFAHTSQNSIRQIRSLYKARKRIPLVHKNFIMTFKVCVNLLGLASVCVIGTLSSRISEEIQRGEMLTTAVRLIHLFTFGTWLGMQFWVTFVAGESAKKFSSFFHYLKVRTRKHFFLLLI